MMSYISIRRRKSWPHHIKSHGARLISNTVSFDQHYGLRVHRRRPSRHAGHAHVDLQTWKISISMLSAIRVGSQCHNKRLKNIGDSTNQLCAGENSWSAVPAVVLVCFCCVPSDFYFVRLVRVLARCQKAFFKKWAMKWDW